MLGNEDESVTLEGILRKRRLKPDLTTHFLTQIVVRCHGPGTSGPALTRRPKARIRCFGHWLFDQFFDQK